MFREHCYLRIKDITILKARKWKLHLKNIVWDNFWNATCLLVSKSERKQNEMWQWNTWL